MNKPPFNRKPVGRRAHKRELQLAADEGGQRVPGSGSGRQKGDVRVGTWLIEDKFSDDESFRLTVSHLLKCEAEVQMTPNASMPQMRVSIGKGQRKRTVRIIWEDDYRALGL